MVIPKDQDGKLGDSLNPQPAEPDASTSTRHGGIQSSEKIFPKVIVDIREFRSELPGLLHKRGIDIEPI